MAPHAPPWQWALSKILRGNVNGFKFQNAAIRLAAIRRNNSSSSPVPRCLPLSWVCPKKGGPSAVGPWGFAVTVRHGPGLAITVAGVTTSSWCLDLIVHGRPWSFIMVIASLVQVHRVFLQKSMPPVHIRPWACTCPSMHHNCGGAGSALLNIRELITSSSPRGLSASPAASAFWFAIVLFAQHPGASGLCRVPKSFEGFPIALVTAGLMALAFMGFSGLVIW